jgi:hypothetical protein
MRDVYVVEREYSTKLQAAVKKAQERRSKRVHDLVVGENPAKEWTDGDKGGRDK